MAFIDFLTWVQTREDTITVASQPILEEFYNNAVLDNTVMERYLTQRIYTFYIYNISLHNSIMDSIYTPAIDENEIDPPDELQGLYVKYGVSSYGVNIFTGGSSAGSSTSGTLPKVIQDSSTLSTSSLLATPYGRYVEQINGEIPSVL